jgi:hypothetical protein
MTNNLISYSAIVLDESSRKKLLNLFQTHFKQEFNSDSNENVFNIGNWKKYCHHMTICLGSLPELYKDDIDKKISLTVEKIGKSDKAIAVWVTGYYTKNKIPHVTIAINTSIGAKPKDSNNITDWRRLDSPFSISGVVKEIRNK